MDFFQQNSNFVAGVDFAFYLIFGIGIFFLIAITIVMLFFVKKYSRKKHPKPIQFKEKAWVEITWFVVPLILVMLMFYYGYVAYSPMRTAPADAMIVKTYGKMWEWTFEYPNGKEAKELFLPVNKPVKLDLISLDVIHGFSVPAFRIKQDLVPGKQNMVWFVPQELGDFEIYCSYYCGLQHSFMGSKVKVIPQQEFEKWLADFVKKEADPEGFVILKKNGCNGCHTIDGGNSIGPTFKNLYGAKKTVIAGGTEKDVVVDELYIRRSIYDPGSEVVKGYSTGIMKSYKGIVKNDELKKITEYFKTLK